LVKRKSELSLKFAFPEMMRNDAALEELEMKKIPKPAYTTEFKELAVKRQPHVSRQCTSRRFIAPLSQ
jgi:hypothetical protein